MRAQLDEIEKNLVQFSPRMLQTDLADDQSISLAAAAPSLHLSPPRSAQFPVIDIFPPTPRLPHYPPELVQFGLSRLRVASSWTNVGPQFLTTVEDNEFTENPFGQGFLCLAYILFVKGRFPERLADNAALSALHLTFST
ncbi:hypothetical protein B0H17DRAFT_700119 [Mycena rosella]|uniref:Uncharacterized protein n=1 Tax=Mycena rosella TaxID=1033263 RepID=A0AAD7DAP9_MYCRO|nr:hypothetical protein B0H17DRAFT_700119 [Mycena rosella]